MNLKFTKHFVLIFLLCLGYNASTYAQAPDPSSSIAIITPSTTFSVGEFVTLKIGFLNASTSPIAAAAQLEWKINVSGAAEVLPSFSFDNPTVATLVNVAMTPYDADDGQLITVTQKPGVIFPGFGSPGSVDTIYLTLKGKYLASLQGVTAQSEYLNTLYHDDNDANDIARVFFNVVGVLSQKLDKFSVKESSCGSVEVKWNTLSEHNLSKFDVQYSANGQTFSTVKTVAAKNNAQGATYTTSVSQQDLVGFYRLMMINADNTFDYSTIEKVGMGCVAAAISIYPNPASELVNITSLQGVETIKFISVDGKVVLEQKAVQGTNVIRVSKLIAGNYTIAISNGDVITNFKIIKK